MKHLPITAIILSVTLLCVIGGIEAYKWHSNTSEQDLGYQRGMILVGAHPGTRSEIIDDSLKTMNLMRSNHDALDLDTAIYFTLPVPSGREKEMIEKMKEFSWVKNAGLNYRYQIPDCSKGPC